MSTNIAEDGEVAHGPQCAQRFVSAAECTCGKADGVAPVSPEIPPTLTPSTPEIVQPAPRWSLDTGGWPLCINEETAPDYPLMATLPLPEGSTGDDAAGLAVVARGQLIVRAVNQRLTDRELATVLDALRAWQSERIEDPTYVSYDGYFYKHAPLNVGTDDDEVDALIEKLNDNRTD